MKSKRMSLYIVSVIILVIMIVGSLGLATWALLSTKLDVSGNIGFTGSGDVLAVISDGTVNGEHTAKQMDGFEIDANYDESANENLKTWKNLDLNFKEDGSNLVLSFSVKNNQAPESGRGLRVDLNCSAQLEGGISMEATAVGKESANMVVIAPQETVVYNITFSIVTQNQKVNRGFSVVLNFANAKPSQACNVTFVVDGVEQVVTVPANQPVGNYFPKDEESCCGYYLNANYTGLVEANTILSDPTLKLYTATATTDIEFTENADGYKVSALLLEGHVFYRRHVIPLKYQGKYVTEIGLIAAADLSGVAEPSHLETIIIPGRVKTIDSFALGGSDSLASITIPASVTSIGEGALGCEITNLTLEEGNSVYHVAGNCLIETATKTLIAGFHNSVIPTDGSVTSIAPYAFKGHVVHMWDPEETLTITIPSNITKIGNNAIDCSGFNELVFEHTSGTIEIGADVFGDGIFTVNLNGKTWTCGAESYTSVSDATVLNGKTWTIA